VVNGQDRHQHIVVGRAPDLDHARQVFQELQNHGVDASDMRLAGKAAERAERRTRDDVARERLDARTTQHVGRQVSLGALVGALAGGAVGAVGGLLVTSGDVGENLALFLVIVLVFGGLGAWVAAIVNATRSMGYDDTWQLTFDDSDGSTWIAVRVRDGGAVTTTRELLAREGITDVEEHTAQTRGAHTVRW
jgi:hypothetical protein